MTTIPATWLISMLAILIAALIVSRSRLPWMARACFATGLGSIALVTALIGARLEQSADALAFIQPHLAILSAPSIWLGFQSLTKQSGIPARPILTLACAAVLGSEAALLLPLQWSADVVISAINLVSIMLLAAMLRLRADAFVHIPPTQFGAIRLSLAAAIGFFSLILLADAAIIAATLSAGDAGMMQALTGVSGLFVGIVLIGTVIGVPLVLGNQTRLSVDHMPLSGSDDTNHELLERIERLLTESLIFRDPDLTLARLGRRLGCPARAVSVAINRGTGENISRYINGFRIRHAKELLTGTDLPVTEVMLEAGFVSKSSFNSEFRRIEGVTPSEFRKAGAKARSCTS